MAEEPYIRQATADDADAYDRIERAAYLPEFAEGKATFLAKIGLFSAGCWMAFRQGEPVGYLLSHPALLQQPPALGSTQSNLVGNADTYFIHSLTLDPSAHGKGIGKVLATKSIELAGDFGFHTMSLISVQNSHPFWERFGFQEWTQLPDSAATKLATYGPTAKYMIRRL